MWARIERTMAKQIRHVRPIARAAADATTQRIATQIERDLGAFVPPFALHAAAPTVLAACWMMLRESLVPGHADRRSKEAVAAAVSRLNACTYCVDAHTAALHALGEATTADALAGAAPPREADGTLAPWVAWAAATRSPGAHALRHPPFPPAAAPEIVGIAFCFHYINRMVAIFLAPSPLPFEHPRLKALARHVIAPILTRLLHRPLAPGESLAWLPDAALAPDFAWAAANPTIAAAFARAAAAFDLAGSAVLPAEVRTLVHDRLQAWQGEETGLGRRWLEDAVVTLDDEHRPVARLALLAAFAPFQVDDAILADLHRTRPDTPGSGDAALIAATAWASFTAARRIATWMAPSSA
jgi:AhpD family alkylhydroperoxidase